MIAPLDPQSEISRAEEWEAFCQPFSTDEQALYRHLMEPGRNIQLVPWEQLQSLETIYRKGRLDIRTMTGGKPQTTSLYFSSPFDEDWVPFWREAIERLSGRLTLEQGGLSIWRRMKLERTKLIVFSVILLFFVFILHIAPWASGRPFPDNIGWFLIAAFFTLPVLALAYGLISCVRRILVPNEKLVRLRNPRF